MEEGRLQLIEASLVILLPIFAALMINNFSKDKPRANMKVVYYKFFIFCAILFIASQIHFIVTSRNFEIMLRIVGDFIMAALIFEFFLLPTEKTHPDDVALFHTLVLWLVTFIFIVLCVYNHFPSLQEPSENWIELHPVKDIVGITKKIYNERTMPTKEVEKLPICNIFGFFEKSYPLKVLPETIN